MTVTEQLSNLDRILAHGDITTLFQPIVSLSQRRALGHEALTRGPPNSALHSPINLLAAARHGGRLNDLEMLCRQNACRRYSQQHLPGKLFLNASPETLLDATHKPGRTLELLQSFGIPASEVVIELTEQTPTDDFELLDTALHHYRTMGFSIALDDLGAGYSSLRMWSQLRPDYVKIDRYFIDGIHLDPVKREFVQSILKIAGASCTQVIAEGIELAEELHVLSSMGVDLVQGYLLGRPQEVPHLNTESLLPEPGWGQATMIEKPHDLSALLIERSAVRVDQPIAEVRELFSRKANLNSIAVVQAGGEPAGIIHRSQLSETLYRAFASERLAGEPISQVMSVDYLAVEASQTLQQVSQLLTGRDRPRIDEEFIITRNGRYHGLGCAIDVLKLMTEMTFRQTRHAQPSLPLSSAPFRHSLQ